MELVSPDHELALKSRAALAKLRQCGGDHVAELSIYRELLQICLLQSGPRNRDTLYFLLGLGIALTSCGQDREAETILYIRVQLDSELSGYLDRTTIDVQNSLASMTVLASTLTLQRRYEDSKSVLNAGERCFKDLLRVENPLSWEFFYEKAMVLRYQGRLVESEQTLRAIVRHAPDYPDVHIHNAMEELADLLVKNGQEQEEVNLREKSLVMAVKLWGIEHIWSKHDCEDLGFCYAGQGRYNDAILHFQETIEKLTLTNGGDLVSRNEYIGQIQGWISEVEEMKEKAKTLQSQLILQGRAPNLLVMLHLHELTCPTRARTTMTSLVPGYLRSFYARWQYEARTKF
jgi:tetratricopeptide (TPR) repeat protein